MVTNLNQDQLLQALSGAYTNYTGPAERFGSYLAEMAGNTGGYTLNGAPLTPLAIANLVPSQPGYDPSNVREVTALGSLGSLAPGALGPTGAPAPAPGPAQGPAQRPAPGPAAGGGGGSPFEGGTVPRTEAPGGLVSGGFSPEQTKILDSLLSSLSAGTPSPGVTNILSPAVAQFQSGRVIGQPEDSGVGYPGIIARAKYDVGQTTLTPLQQAYVTGLGGGQPGEQLDLMTLPGAREQKAVMDRLFEDYMSRTRQEMPSLAESTAMGSMFARTGADLAKQFAATLGAQRTAGLGVGLSELDKAIARRIDQANMEARALESERAGGLALANLGLSGLASDRGAAFNTAGLGLNISNANLGRAMQDYLSNLQFERAKQLLQQQNEGQLIGGLIAAGAYTIGQLGTIIPAIRSLFPGVPPNTPVTVAPNGNVYTNGVLTGAVMPDGSFIDQRGRRIYPGAESNEPLPPGADPFNPPPPSGPYDPGDTGPGGGFIPTELAPNVGLPGGGITEGGVPEIPMPYEFLAPAPSPLGAAASPMTQAGIPEDLSLRDLLLLEILRQEGG